MTHLSQDQIIQYIHQTLTDAERETMDRHLADCPRCRARLDDHERLQRRIRYGLRSDLRVALPSSRLNFTHIAGRVKRSRRRWLFAGYPQSGRYLWHINPDGTDLMLQEDIVGDRVVRRESDAVPSGQWWFEGTELQVMIPHADLDESDLWGCHVIGRYHIQPVEGGGIKFDLIEDACSGRREVMIGEVWQREAE